MNKTLQRLGGAAAVMEGLLYVAGMIYFILVVDYMSVSGAEARVQLLVDNLLGLIAINTLIYIVFGVALVVLAVALHERLSPLQPALMQLASAFGIIWAGVVIVAGMLFNLGAEQAVLLNAKDSAAAGDYWHIIDTVHQAMGGGVEILGGLWMLFVSLAGLRGKEFPGILNWLGLLVGFAGTITLIPPLSEIGGIFFGLGQIVWFLWIGILMMIRSAGPASAP